MTTPAEFYAVYRYYTAFQLRSTSGAWGAMSDGFPDRAEAVECIINGFDKQDENCGVYADLDTVKAVKIDLAEGTSRDVTEDLIAEAFALGAARLAERGWAAQ